jgi:hypothetical protein
MIKKFFNYLGPDSPLGSTAGALLTVCFLFLMGFLIGPFIVKFFAWYWAWVAAL